MGTFRLCKFPHSLSLQQSGWKPDAASTAKDTPQTPSSKLHSVSITHLHFYNFQLATPTLNSIRRTRKLNIYTILHALRSRVLHIIFLKITQRIQHHRRKTYTCIIPLKQWVTPHLKPSEHQRCNPRPRPTNCVKRTICWLRLPQQSLSNFLLHHPVRFSPLTSIPWMETTFKLPCPNTLRDR